MATKEKKAKSGGMVGIADPDDKLKEVLPKIKEYWESKFPASFSNANIVSAVMEAYWEQLQKAKPDEIDFHNLLKVK